MEDLLLPDPLHLPQLNSQRWLRQLQQRYKIKRHLQGIIPLTWFYSNDICHHGFSRSKYFHLLFLLVQNRQQTQGWTLIGSGADGLGIQECCSSSKCNHKWPSIQRWQYQIHNGILKSLVRLRRIRNPFL